MLIEKLFKKGDIMSIKLLTGEEVVAEYLESDTETVNVSKPCHFFLNDAGMHFPPYLMTSQETRYSFPTKNIMIMAPTASQVAKIYREQTTSIQLV
jgi:hypothetical protein